MASQVLGGAGLAAGVTVGALLAQEMLGSEGLAGIPTALFALGAALTAFLVGRTTHRWGRRTGLGLGFCVGGLGAIGVVVAATDYAFLSLSGGLLALLLVPVLFWARRSSHIRTF